MANSNSSQENATVLNFKEAVCIDAPRVYDSCSDKDCLEDLLVTFSPRNQRLVDHAAAVKCKSVSIYDVDIDVEPLSLNRGYYAVDITYKFEAKFILTMCRGSNKFVKGTASFTKKVILFGSEGNSKVFSSCVDGVRDNSNMPCVSVNVVDPVILLTKLCDPPCDWSFDNCDFVNNAFDENDDCECNNKNDFHHNAHSVKNIKNDCDCDDDFDNRGFLRSEDDFEIDSLQNQPNGNLNFRRLRPKKVIYLTLGIFSIIKIQRNVQMLIPAYDYCIPCKECSTVSAIDDPCEVFRRIQFPVDDFFPPRLESDDLNNSCSC